VALVFLVVALCRLLAGCMQSTSSAMLLYIPLHFHYTHESLRTEIPHVNVISEIVPQYSVLPFYFHWLQTTSGIFSYKNTPMTFALTNKTYSSKKQSVEPWGGSWVVTLVSSVNGSTSYRGTYSK
jgi:hypothetical protein